jgi:hypothetical protein
MFVLPQEGQVMTLRHAFWNDGGIWSSDLPALLGCSWHLKASTKSAAGALAAVS